MKKLIPLILMMSSQLSFAVDTDTITFIHAKTKSVITEICKEKMRNIPAPTCDCIGNTAQNNLDDKVLQGCATGKAGRVCIQKAVEKASLLALSKESVNSCKKKPE